MSIAVPVSSSPWQSLILRTLKEVELKIQREKPELLTNTFTEPLHFFPPTASSDEVIRVWLQSESHRTQIAQVCCKDVKDITKECFETCAAFICLRINKAICILRPIPEKTLVIIGLGRLHVANGIFKGIDLQPGGSAIVSGDRPQSFDGNCQGGGIGIALRLKFKCTPLMPAVQQQSDPLSK